MLDGGERRRGIACLQCDRTRRAPSGRKLWVLGSQGATRFGRGPKGSVPRKSKRFLLETGGSRVGGRWGMRQGYTRACTSAAQKEDFMLNQVLRAAGLLLIGTLVVAGCVTTTRPTPTKKPAVPTVVYERGQWSDLPGWNTDSVQEAWQAFLESCHALRFRAEWASSCMAAQTVPQSAAAVRQYFQGYFVPYKIVKHSGETREDTGLITGYFEPLLQGSRTPSPKFMAPLYAPPPDLLTVDLASLFPELKGKRVRGRLEGNKVVPYYTRAELPTDPTLHGDELVWIDNSFDALMLEVQGSGRVHLPDWHDDPAPICRPEWPALSLRRALPGADWRAHGGPGDYPGYPCVAARTSRALARGVGFESERGVFQRSAVGRSQPGTEGAQGIPLTSGRSIAVDASWVPLGTPVFLATTLPTRVCRCSGS